MSTFVVRPSNTEKEAFRVRLTAVSLLSLRLKSGDLCTIRQETLTNGDHQSPPLAPPRYAIAWENSGTGMKDYIVQTSKLLQELYELKLGNKVVIERAGEVLRDADVVRLRPKAGVVLSDRQRKFWEEFAKLTVRSSYECLATGQVLSFKVGPELQELEVSDPDAGGVGIGRITDQTLFSISDSAAGSDPSSVEFKSTQLGGLESQIEFVRKMIERLLRPRIPSKYAPRQGLLLYGTKGVGKTFFIEELAASGWKTVVHWQPGTKLPSLNSSTLIIIDQLDLPSARNDGNSAIREIDRLFEAVKGRPCLVVGETRHPNDVHQHLRSKSKFSFELEIPIPSALQRRQILTAMRGEEMIPDDQTIESIAGQTHGYVAADLFDLLRTTLELASERPVSEHEMQPTAVPGEDFDTSGATTTPPTTITEPPSAPSKVTWTVTTADISLALSQIRPSALQEIFLETPNTRWTDIGGQHTSKRLLVNAVDRPLRAADRMARLNLRPKKGVLLYGPPGCSKTLLVRALAREAGLNFLAVKGAELISMYVGESERATREIFRKARAASPSIIFFDEIDAIASRSTANKASSSSDLNVLTTLLNEMDGFETMRGVFVVAATNKPDQIDPALLRPGRFDNIVYIPPPDLEARKEIFATQFRQSNYTATPRGTEDDIWYFAEKTQGYSGAEVVAICQAAAEMALDNERDFYRFQDVEEAVRGMPRSISKEMLEDFEQWGEKRMMGV